MSVTLDFLKASGGQQSLYGPLGRWARTISQAIDGGISGTRTVDMLKAAQGVISLHSARGKFMMALSQAVDAGISDKKMIADMFRAQAGEQQNASPYGDFEISALLRSP